MQNNDSIGALWVKEKAGSGNVYMTGNVTVGGEKVAIVCFRNTYKKDNQPDWKILRAKPKGERQTDPEPEF
jgi:hypothetical protein